MTETANPKTAKAKTTKAKATWLNWLGLGAFALLLVVAWFFAAAMQLAIPAYLPLYAYLIYALACCLPFSPFIFAGRFRRAKISLHIVFLTSVALLWFFPMSSRQPFLRDLHSIQPGMTATQVNAIMGKYMTGTGWPANPFDAGASAHSTLTDVGSGLTHQTKTNGKGEIAIAGSITFRHSDEGEYNSDWGVVSFEKGRVVKVEFMPD